MSSSGHAVLARYTNGEGDIVVEPRMLAELILAAERDQATRAAACAEPADVLEQEQPCRP